MKILFVSILSTHRNALFYVTLPKAHFIDAKAMSCCLLIVVAAFVAEKYNKQATEPPAATRQTQKTICHEKLQRRV